MKRCLPLIGLCLLLTGCAAQTVPETTESTAAAVQTIPAETEPVSLYVPGHPLEQAAPGALQVYPLRLTQAKGIRILNGNVLLLSGSGSTTLTLLAPPDMTVYATAQLSFELDWQDPSFRISGDTLSYFDPIRMETVVLSDTLKEVSRIAAPDGLVGSPILSADRNTLYYCTKSAIRAWNLETGIRRCVKELSYEVQELTGLHQEDTILQCLLDDSSGEKTVFLATDTGRQLAEVPGKAQLNIQGGRYYLSVPDGAITAQLFGQIGQEPQVLSPGDIYANCYYLAGQERCVTVSESGSPIIDCYALDTGLRTARLALDDSLTPISVAACGTDSAYLLLQNSGDSDLLCRWDYQSDVCQTGDLQVYTSQRYTKKAPDAAALAECQAEATRIGEKYGIRVLLWEDSLAVAPWDYEFTPEYLAPVLQRELADLDQRLSYYPAEIWEGIRSHFSGLTICLVRQIRGSAESGSLEQATGVQFFQNGESYIAIAVGRYSERALYHELYHVMETRLLTDSAAFDRWDNLNPAGFSYDLDYATNAQRNAGEYLQEGTRSFIDTYSMSFPKEDRARIMECAMQSGNKALFQSPVMQAKLACLCRAIREAYGLKKSPDTFRWEQYLE